MRHVLLQTILIDLDRNVLVGLENVIFHDISIREIIWGNGDNNNIRPEVILFHVILIKRCA